jgi:hypothetical protein
MRTPKFDIADEESFMIKSFQNRGIHFMTLQWDFFLAHAGADQDSAEKLYGLLIGEAKVFLDSKCLKWGDNWPRALAEAQRNSFITVVLISGESDEAYYEQEEIAAAVEMARQDSEKHRVVPIYLTDKVDSVPYGLKAKHSMIVSELGGLEATAESLLQLLRGLKDVERRTNREDAASANEEISPSRRKDTPGVNGNRLARQAENRYGAVGVSEISKILRPIITVLLFIVCISVMAMITCIAIPAVRNGIDLRLALSGLGSISTLSIGSLTFVFNKFLSAARGL